MVDPKRWGYILTAATVVLWGGFRLAGWTFPNWILVILGLMIGTLFTAHYAKEYTT